MAAKPEKVEIPEELQREIGEAIAQVQGEKERRQVRALEREDPDKVASILGSLANGKSVTFLVKKCGYERKSVARIQSDYADYLGQWKEMARSHTGTNYLMMQHAKQELAQKLIERIENDPDFVVTPRDLKEMAVAESITLKDALTIRGEASQITKEERVTTVEDVKSAQEEFLKSIQEAEVVQE